MPWPLQLLPPAVGLHEKESEEDDDVLVHIRPVDLELAVCRSVYDDPRVSRLAHDPVLASPGSIALFDDSQGYLIDQQSISRLVIHEAVALTPSRSGTLFG